MERRGPDIDAAGSFTELGLNAIVDSSVPSALLLEQLAPALGLHIQDVFVLAGAAVPEDLTALDPAAGVSAINMAFAAMSLPTERTHQLIQLVQALPQAARRKPVLPPRYDGPGPGSFLLG